MKPSQLFAAVNSLINCGLPGFIWGSPGIGKSEIVAQVAASRSTKAKPYELRDVRLGLMDPTDIKGFPSPDAKANVMRWLPPDFLPAKGQGLLFLDEMNTAPPAVQAAAYQLVLNRRVGNYELPPGWSVMAAGNNDTDRAVTHRMSTALSNRMVHLKLDVDVHEWTQHAIAKGIGAERIAFIRFRSHLLHQFDPHTKSHAFPSPRSWFYLDKIARDSVSEQVQYQLMQGTVGEGAAGEYMAFLKTYRDLPTVDEILLNPGEARTPTTPAAQYAITTTLGIQSSEINYAKLLTYMERLPVEFQVVFQRDASGRLPKIQYLPEFGKWAMKNQSVFV